MPAMGRFILRAHDHNMTNGEFALFTLFPMQGYLTDTPWFAYGRKDPARIRPAFRAIKQVRARFSTNYRGRSFCGFCTFVGYYTTHSALNLVLFLMNILPSPISSHHFRSFLAILISVSSVVSVLILTLKQPAPSLPILPTLNLTTVTLCTLIFLTLK